MTITDLMRDLNKVLNERGNLGVVCDREDEVTHDVTVTAMPNNYVRVGASCAGRPSTADVATLRYALEQSVRLQSHYAQLLNDYDGGKRATFASATDWLEALQRTREAQGGNAAGGRA